MSLYTIDSAKTAVLARIETLVSNPTRHAFIIFFKNTSIAVGQIHFPRNNYRSICPTGTSGRTVIAAKRCRIRDSALTIIH